MISLNDLKDIIEEIKSRCDIVDIISDYMHLEKSGSNYTGLCPFHSEKTGSFMVSSLNKYISALDAMQVEM